MFDEKPAFIAATSFHFLSGIPMPSRLEDEPSLADSVDANSKEERNIQFIFV
jgi:hypothetical protein